MDSVSDISSLYDSVSTVSESLGIFIFCEGIENRFQRLKDPENKHNRSYRIELIVANNMLLVNYNMHLLMTSQTKTMYNYKTVKMP